MIILNHNKDQRKLDYRIINFYVLLNELCYHYDIPQLEMKFKLKKFEVNFSGSFINIVTDYDIYHLKKYD